MARSYSRVVRGYPDLDDSDLIREFEDFTIECKGKGGVAQIRASRDGDFELTCSIREDGAFGEREERG